MENGVNFNSEDQLYASRGGGRRPGSRMAGWLISLSGGAVRNEQTANYILFGFAVIVFIVAAVILFSSF